jgi:hypothetical protein
MNLLTRIRTKLKQRKYKKFIKYYRNNPDRFCEEFLGIKLFEYQRKILRGYNKKGATK